MKNDLEAHKLSMHEEKIIFSICEFSSKKRYDLELHTITKLDNKCNVKTEGQNQVKIYIFKTFVWNKGIQVF